MGYSYVSELGIQSGRALLGFVEAWHLRRFKKSSAPGGLELVLWFGCIVCPALWTVLSVM